MNEYPGKIDRYHTGLLELSEGHMYNLDGIQHFKSIKQFISQDGKYVDARPLENLIDLETLSIEGPIYSLKFKRTLEQIIL